MDRITMNAISIASFYYLAEKTGINVFDYLSKELIEKKDLEKENQRLKQLLKQKIKSPKSN